MHEQPFTVAIVSDYDIVERGLADALAGHPSLRLVGPVPDTGPPGPEPVELVLYDPYGRTHSAERVLRALVRHPLVRHVALFSLDLPTALVADARRLGVRAFVTKSLPTDRLAAALLEAAAGGAVDAGPTGADASGAARSWPGRDDGLSERESEVLLLCGEGLSNREIADTLYLSLETVKTHLKNVYARLGLRNRAQAATYLHGTGTFPRLRPVAWSAGDDDRGAAGGRPTGRDASADRAGDAAAGARRLADELGLDDGVVTDRLALLGLTAAARARLAPYVDAVREAAPSLVDRLYDRLEAHEDTAPFLDDERVVARLRAAQAAYTVDLFASPLDRDHVERMVRIGATHHRVRLGPQWYLATYAPLVCEHLPLLFERADDDAAAVEATVVLLSTALFDAGLVLDAYELSLVDALVRAARAATPDAPGGPAPASPGDATSPAPARRALTRMTLTRDEAERRRRLVGLDDEAVAALAALGPVIERAAGDVLDGFYELVRASPALAALVPAETVPRLLDQVGAYWTELAGSRFDRTHAAASMRVGVIHERIGLTPPLYLAGLARQVTGLLRALVRPGADVRREVDALVRAVFFDATFVIDAYLGARADTLLQTGRYAEQLVSGLASGVAVVDDRGRIEHANAQLLEMVGTPAGVLRRMPVESALPFPGIADLVDAARRAPAGRQTLGLRSRGRHLRITALPLRPTIGNARDLVAVVVDDISDVVRADERAARDGRAFDHVVAAVDAAVWELDAETLTVLAVSRPVEALTGRRDVDLLGRAGTELVHPGDRARFAAACAEAAAGRPVHLEHRVAHEDGTVRGVRSALSGLVDPRGVRTVCGVTMLSASPHAPAAGADGPG